jgi:hypothetical protein
MPLSIDPPESSVQRIILCISTLLLAACVTQPKNTDRQAVLLAQPLTPNSLMREGDVINFQVIEPRDPQSVVVQRFQYSAACSTAQINEVYSFLLMRHIYPGNPGHYAPARALPERYHATLLNNRDFLQACKNLPVADWRKVAEDDTGRWLLVDKNNLQNKAGQVDVWMAYDEPKTRLNLVNSAPFTQTREHYTFDCATRNSTLLARYFLNADNQVTDGKIDMFPETKVITASEADKSKMVELVCNAPTSIASLPALTRRSKAAVDANAIPDISPNVLKNIEQLHLPKPLKTLTYLDLAGTASNSKKSWPERTEYFISTDPVSQQLSIDHNSENLVGHQISWRGLLTLSGREQAKLSRNTLVIDNLSFRGDWQQMRVGSQLGYTRQGSINSNLIGSLGEEPVTVDCTVDSESPAKLLNPALSGNAKAISCRDQRKSLKPVPMDHYYYLVDYGFFYHASTDKGDGIAVDMHVQSVK